MRDLNKVILIGRLGGEPIRRETRNGLAVTHFSLATGRRMKPESERPEGPSDSRDWPLAGNVSKGGSTEETVWHRVVAWGKQAETCALYLHKGSSIFVEGSIRTSKYKDKEGNSRTSYEVHADIVGFLGGGIRRQDAGDSEAEAGDPNEGSSEPLTSVAFPQAEGLTG